MGFLAGGEAERRENARCSAQGTGEPTVTPNVCRQVLRRLVSSFVYRQAHGYNRIVDIIGLAGINYLANWINKLKLIMSNNFAWHLGWLGTTLARGNDFVKDFQGLFPMQST